ncbi:hypothetical protein AGMMS49992_23510 [Clostridia bacterium]|nr:hypothetical protein AGMMS49992_23510 [Clostridia bacterium]
MRRILLLIMVMTLVFGAVPGGAAFAQDERPLFTVAWAHLFGGEGDSLVKAAATSDGKIWLAGTASSESDKARGGSDGWALLLDGSGETLWSNRYGGSGDDSFIDVLPLADGGAILLGQTTSYDGQVRNYRGGVDAWVVRVDVQGDMLWQKCLGGTLDDSLVAIRALSQASVPGANTPDDCIVLAGWTMSYNNDLNTNKGGQDGWVCAIRMEDGRSIWHYRMGEAADDWYGILLPDRSGVLAVGGTTRVDAQGNKRAVPILTTIGFDGQEISTVRLQLKDDAWIYDAVQTSDGWMLAGKIGAENSDAWLGRVAAGGAFNAIYLDGNMNGALSIIQQYPSNVTLAVGSLNSDGSALQGAHGGQDVWVVGMTRDKVEWQQALGGSGETSPIFVTRHSDGRYLIVSSTTAEDGDLTPRAESGVGWIVLLDINGNFLRQSVIAPYGDQRFTAAVAANGGIVLVGEAVDEDGAWRAAVVKAGGS